MGQSKFFAHFTFTPFRTIPAQVVSIRSVRVEFQFEKTPQW